MTSRGTIVSRSGVTPGRAFRHGWAFGRSEAWRQIRWLAYTAMRCSVTLHRRPEFDGLRRSCGRGRRTFIGTASLPMEFTDSNAIRPTRCGSRWLPPLTFGWAVANEPKSRRLQRQTLRSFEHMLDLNRRKTTTRCPTFASITSKLKHSKSTPLLPKSLSAASCQGGR